MDSLKDYLPALTWSDVWTFVWTLVPAFAAALWGHFRYARKERRGTVRDILLANTDFREDMRRDNIRLHKRCEVFERAEEECRREMGLLRLTVAQVSLDRDRLQLQNDRMSAELFVLKQTVLRIEEAQTVGIVLVDQAGMIVDWSGAATEILGWERDAIVGRSLRSLFPETQRQLQDEILGHAILSDANVELTFKDSMALTRANEQVPVQITLTTEMVGERRHLKARIRRRLFT